jgi:hypothetical protein
MSRRGLYVVLVAIVLLVVPIAIFKFPRHSRAAPPPAADERAPIGARIRVQVLNSTKTHGLAQRATTMLRDRGFDVVETGTIAAARDTTLVLDLSGHPDWARRVARAFEPARVETRPDSSRYLDVAVILGSAWRPPAEPFNP